MLSRRILAIHLIADLLLLVSSFLIAFWVRFNTDLFPERPVPDVYLYVRFGLFSGIIGLLCLQICGVYTMRARQISLDLFFAILQSMSLSGVVVVLVSFLFRELLMLNGQETLSRLIIAIAFFISTLLLALWRVLFFSMIHHFWRRGWSELRLLLVGSGDVFNQLKDVLNHSGGGYQIVGYCGDLDFGDKIKKLGEIEQIDEVIDSQNIQEVVTAIDGMGPDLMLRVMRSCERKGLRFSVFPDPSTLLLLPAGLHDINGVPLMSPRRGLSYGLGRHIKRLLDIILSSVFLVLMSPILLLTSVFILIDSPGPTIFRQERVGMHGRRFLIYKFRSMRTDADELPAPPSMMDRDYNGINLNEKDVRVTRIGHWLRRLSIDEFPQFVNVLKGDMSIVGPRPHMVSEVKQYEDWHHRRFDVKPGITGHTQVSGRKDLKIDDMVKLDIYYIENWSVLLDIKIMIQTVPALFFGRGAY